MKLLPTIESPGDVRALRVEQLPELAGEIRAAIIGQVATSGGHLAPNLGVVELTIALHYVFDFGFDRLLFDVGHQCYPHKLLTGRLGLLGDLRTSKGMSGFPEPLESNHDLFRVGHAGTAISTGVGMARGDTLTGEAFHPEANPDGRRVVTLIGDGSIVNGLALEGLNNAGTLDRQMLVVLNDNGMSISKPQGALAQYFDRVRVSHTYSDLKKGAGELLRHIPGGGLIKEAYHRTGEATKAQIAKDSLFERFGLMTVGPIDGHDLPTLIEFLHEARDFDRPMVLHVKTIKGKGLDVAEADATRFHSPKAFEVERGEGVAYKIRMKSSGRSFTSAFGEALLGLMERDERVVAATAAMPDGSGVTPSLEKYPDRSFDTGICESHAMDMLAGMAKCGLKPFFAVYSTFLQRAFDQAFQEVALQGLPVRLCLDRAGLVGGDGAVHHGFCDTTLLRSLPGAVLLAAIDEPSLEASLDFMLGWESGLSAVRYPRDSVSERLIESACPAFELGRARCLTDEWAWLGASDGEKTPSASLRSAPPPSGRGRREDVADLPDVAVLGFGTPVLAALEAADLLAGVGSGNRPAPEYRVAVWDARFAKPVDAGLIRALLSRNIPIVTLEDHSVVGGFGSAVLESAAEQGLDASRVIVHGIPDRWITQDSRDEQLAQVGLDARGIARVIRRAVDRASAAPATETASPTRERGEPVR